MIILGFFNRKGRKTIVKKNNGKIKEWPDHTVILNDNNFNDFIGKYPLSVVDFWAPWCSPCRTMMPRLRRLSNIYKGKVAFGRLNTQNNKYVSNEYKIMSIPHLVFFSYGKKISDKSGVMSIGDFKDLIDDLLKKV
jgi:thioredoxin 1